MRKSARITPRSLNSRDLINLLPPRLESQSLGWVLEDYWDESLRLFFNGVRNNYTLQMHRPAAPPQSRKGPNLQLLCRLILADQTGTPLAWVECEGIQKTYFKVSVVVGTRDSQDPIWLREGKPALELLVSALAILLGPDQIALTAVNASDLATLAAWNLGASQAVLSPVLGALHHPTAEPLLAWQYFIMDLTQFRESETGHNLTKSLNYLEMRRARTQRALNISCQPVAKRRGFLARIFARPR
jgi:hypothetical protein